jgi:hypothetical protein
MLLYGDVFPAPLLHFLCLTHLSFMFQPSLTHFSITTRKVTQYVCNVDKLKTSLQTYAALHCSILVLKIKRKQ